MKHFIFIIIIAIGTFVGLHLYYNVKINLEGKGKPLPNLSELFETAEETPIQELERIISETEAEIEEMSKYPELNFPSVIRVGGAVFAFYGDNYDYYYVSGPKINQNDCNAILSKYNNVRTYTKTIGEDYRDPNSFVKYINTFDRLPGLVQELKVWKWQLDELYKLEAQAKDIEAQAKEI